MNKKCMKCGNAATHKFVRVDGGQVYDIYFCQEHAAETSPYMKKPNPLPLGEILASLLSQQSDAGGPPVEMSLKCGTCGLPYQAFKKTFFFGCPDCYESFLPQIVPELRRVHGNIKHVGRKPGGGREMLDEAAPVRPAASPPVQQSPPPPAIVEIGGANVAAPQTSPQLSKQGQAEIARLVGEMNKAIADEDFEKAGRCRDQIRQLREPSK